MRRNGTMNHRGWLLAAGIGVCALGNHVFGADHLEAPLVSLDHEADFNDVYVFQSTSSADRILLTYGTAGGLTSQDDPFGDAFWVDLGGIFDLGGTPVQINDSALMRDAYEPKVVVNDDGIVMTTFLNFDRFDPNNPGSSDPPLALRRTFDAAGHPVTPATNLSGGEFQFIPVLSTSNKGFFAAFFDFDGGMGQYTSGRFDADGEPIGPPNTILTIDPGSFEPRIGLAPKGFGATDDTSADNFLITIENVTGNFPFSADLRIRQINRLGSPLTNEVLVSGANVPNFPGVDVNRKTGGASVVWQEFTQSFVPIVFHQPVDADGSLGTKTTLGDTPGSIGAAQQPDVAVNRHGKTLVTFTAQNAGGSSDIDVFGQVFGPNGVRVGGPFRINSFTEGTQRNSSVSPFSNGDFAVTFTTDAPQITQSMVEQTIAGLRILGPRNINRDTVLADDYGTPWNDLATAELTAAFNGGATDENNFVSIVQDPLDDENLSGRLMFSLDNGGVLDLNSTPYGFPNGRRLEDDVTDIALRAVAQGFTGSFALEDNTEAMLTVTGYPFLSAQQDGNAPGDPFTIAELSIPLPTTALQWEMLEASVDLDQQIIDMIVAHQDTLGLGYTLSVSTDGAAEVLLDELRVEFITPAAIVLGDMDGSGTVDAFDVDDFELALADKQAYIDSHPGQDPDALGDFDGSGTLDAFDVAGFETALASIGGTLPEPGGGAVMITMGVLTIRRHRGRQRRRGLPVRGSRAAQHRKVFHVAPAFAAAAAADG